MGAVPDPALQEVVNLLLGGLRVTATEILTHHADTGSLEPEGDSEAASDEPRTVVHDPILPGPNDPPGADVRARPVPYR